MNAKPVLASRHAGTSILVAALSSGITIGILAGITNLFVHDGAPFEQTLIAERACADHAYVSERESCVRGFVATSHLRKVASR